MTRAWSLVERVALTDTVLEAPWLFVARIPEGMSTVEIDAEGAWSTPGLFSCGPDGVGGAIAASGPTFTPAAPTGALIGKFGGSSADLPSPSGTPAVFVVGSTCEAALPSDGDALLFVTVNVLMRPVKVRTLSLTVRAAPSAPAAEEPAEPPADDSSRGRQRVGTPEGRNAMISVDAAAVRRFAPQARADLVEAIVAGWPSAVAQGISTPLRAWHFLAQIAHETGGFARIDENMNYSAEGLLRVFGNRVTQAQAQALHRKPQEIANHVYGGRLGNHKPNDGWDYRGSGFIQLTGRENFRKRGAEIGMDLEGNPELARTPGPGFAAAVAYWLAAGCNASADADDARGVRKRINPALQGLSEARDWLDRAKRAFPDGARGRGRAREPAAAARQRDIVRPEVLAVGLVGVAAGLILGQALGSSGALASRGTPASLPAPRAAGTLAESILRGLRTLQTLPREERSDYLDDAISPALAELAAQRGARSPGWLSDWLRVQAAGIDLAIEGLGEVTQDLYEAMPDKVRVATAALPLEQRLPLEALLDGFDQQGALEPTPAVPRGAAPTARATDRVLAVFTGASIFTSSRGFPAIAGTLALFDAAGQMTGSFNTTTGGGAATFRSTNGPLPPGSYRVSNHRPNRTTAGMVREGVGYSFDLVPTSGTDVFGRTDFRIHPDGPSRGTNGCLGVEEGAQQLRQCESLIAGLLNTGGPLKLDVHH